MTSGIHMFAYIIYLYIITLADNETKTDSLILWDYGLCLSTTTRFARIDKIIWRDAGQPGVPHVGIRDEEAAGPNFSQRSPAYAGSSRLPEGGETARERFFAFFILSG